MHRLLTLFALFALALPASSSARNPVEVTSPDGHLAFSIRTTPEAPLYQVVYKKVTLIAESPLGLTFKDADAFQQDLVMRDPLLDEVDETYQLVVGKTKHARSHYREAIIPLRESRGLKRQVDVIVRIFNDGVAFRYAFPLQENWTSYVLTEEKSGFNITGDPLVRTLLWDTYVNAHEGSYHTLRRSQLPEDRLLDVPALFEFPDKVYMAITEANLHDFAGMYLINDDGMLRTQLTPFPDHPAVKVKAELPHETPWRVMMISDRIGALIESNILTNLNEPPEIEDTSWITPGKTTFHWWNGDVLPDMDFAPGNNFKTNKYYIDFCARNGIEYHAVIGYGGAAWYRNDWPAYGKPGSYSDATKPVASLDMQAVCDYAKTQGVGIHLWVHWEALYPQLEEAFAQFEEWGVSGMMVDFLDRSDQEMVKIQEEILRKAAEHELYIQFHGAYKPTGRHRTHPNEFTREGALNYEYNKWRDEPVSPEHDLDIVFTRLLAGPTDYHLGGFRAVPENEFKTQYTRPLMIATRGHMLAMYVVLESYLASLCDFPEAYDDEPGFDFLKAVPTTWDETRVLAAEVDQFVVIARRKGNAWFLGSINNREARTLEVALDFLPEGEHQVELYSDGPEVGTDPNQLATETREVRSSDQLMIRVASGGGFAARITKR